MLFAYRTEKYYNKKNNDITSANILGFLFHSISANWEQTIIYGGMKEIHSKIHNKLCQYNV